MLLTLGLIWVGLGHDVLVMGDPATWAGLPLFQAASQQVRGWTWIGTGLVAIVIASRPSRLRWDGLGFLALYLMPAFRALALLWGYADVYLPLGGPGYPQGLRWGLTWLAITALVAITSRWPEPPRRGEGMGL